MCTTKQETHETPWTPFHLYPNRPKGAHTKICLRTSALSSQDSLELSGLALDIGNMLARHVDICCTLFRLRWSRTCSPEVVSRSVHSCCPTDCDAYTAQRQSRTEHLCCKNLVKLSGGRCLSGNKLITVSLPKNANGYAMYDRVSSGSVAEDAILVDGLTAITTVHVAKANESTPQATPMARQHQHVVRSPSSCSRLGMLDCTGSST